MASTENRQHNPSPAPPSPSAGGHEMHDYYAAQDASRPPLQPEPYLTPYLGLRARLSQTWINRWTILLLLVLVRTLFAVASLNNSLSHAKREALSACTSVENIGSTMASMPHYLSTGMNEMTAKGIEMAINGLMDVIRSTVTGVEEIVLFIIKLLTSTYVCLLSMAISGGIDAATDAAKFVGTALNATIQDVGKALGDADSDFQDAMNSFIKDLDHFGASAPTINLTSEISELNGLQLPSGYDANLTTLTVDNLTFANVQNYTNYAIQFPFLEVQKLLNESLPTYNVSASLFPVPAKQQLTFCSDNDSIEDFFEDLVKTAYLAEKIFLAVIIILAILAMIPMAWREMRGYRSMKKRAILVTSDALDPMDAVYIASRPYTSFAGLKVAEKFSSSRRKALIRWAVAYCTTIPALFVLSLALAGLLACLCQYILLKAVEKEVPILENDVIGFADKVINSLNSASEQWAVGANQVINDTSTKINQDLFSWVNTTTTAVNNTLNTFVDEMEGVLNKTFGGTPLYTPVQDVIQCLILHKIEGIESALTWVQDHAYVDFPQIANNTFSLGTIAKVSGSPSDILNTGPNGGAADAITAAIDDVIEFAIKTIRQEAIIASCLLLIWFFIAGIGFTRAIFMMFKGGDLDHSYVSRSWNKDGSSRQSQIIEKDDLNDVPLQPEANVPTYEQAITAPHANPDDNSGNKYNGQNYTLTPRPVPNVEVSQTTNSPTFNTGFRSPGEKTGFVNGQAVDAAIRRPTHLRASSHGDVQITSPISTQPQNPFMDPRYLSTDPF